MSKIDDVARDVAVLKERVDGNIKFFWAVIAIGFAWLAGISVVLYNLNGKISQLPTTLSTQLIEQSRKFAGSGSPEDAARSLNLAAALITSLKTNKTKVSPGYFAQISIQLQEMASESQPAIVRNSAHTALTYLADYKTAIQSVPDLSGPKKEIERSFQTAVSTRTNVKILFGVSVFPVYVHGDLFDTTPPLKLSNNIVIEGPAVFVGMVPDASQTLDGVHWLGGVTFVNMLIRYNGGEVELQNVNFVNCRFEIANTQSGNLLAFNIARSVSGLKVPG